MSEDKSSRADASRRYAPEPTDADMAAAARRLDVALRHAVRNMDALKEAGCTEGEAWRRVRSEIWQSPPQRAGVVRAPGVVQAVRSYAVRTVLEERARLLGMILAEIARRFIDGDLTAEEAVEAAAEWRPEWCNGDDTNADRCEHRAGLRKAALDELMAVASKGRNDETRWKAAYRALAWDADVHVRPDTRRGWRGPPVWVDGVECRGPLHALYVAVTRDP